MKKKRTRILAVDCASACEVAASGAESGRPFAGNPALIERLREAARVLRAIEETGKFSSQRDGIWIFFQLPEDRVE